MIYPDALWTPGVNAGYRAGRNSMVTTVCHFTVGRDSTGIGLQGYFHFLIGRDGTVKQFCEADAVAWHAGDPWNSRGPGVEIEYLPGEDVDIFTPASRAACSKLINWLPVPAYFYDGPRRTDWHGYITHRSLVQTGDQHTDFWPQSDWDAMTAAPPSPVHMEDDMPTIIRDTGNPPRTLLVTEENVYEVDPLTAPNVVCTKAQADFIIADIRAKHP